jgi:hypothetical protein
MFITEMHFEPKPKRDVGLNCDSHRRNSLLQISSASHSLLKLTNNHVTTVLPIANVMLVTGNSLFRIKVPAITFFAQGSSYTFLDFLGDVP